MTATRSDGDKRFILGAFAMGHMSNDWAVGSIWLIASAVAVSEGLGSTEVGWLLTIHGLGSALAYIPAGLAADRTTRRGPLLGLTFWWVAIGYFVASFAPSFWILSMMLAIAVLGDAAWHPIASGVLVQRFPDRRAQVLGIHSMGGTLGAEVLAPIAVGAILTFGDWRLALRLSVIPAVIMGVVFISVSKRLGECAPSPAADNSLRALLRPWRTKNGKAFVATVVLYNMAYMAIVAMMPLFLQQDLEHSALYTGVVLAVMLTVGSFMQPAVGGLSDRIGRKPIMFGGSILGAGFAAIAGLANNEWLAVGGLIGVAGVLTAIRSVVLASAVELAGDREATNLGMAFTLMDGVGAFGAVLAGYVGRNDLPNAFLLAAGLALAGALAARWLDVESAHQAVATPTAPG